MESPLDVLSMAASIIQQKEANSRLEVRKEENADRDGSNDSGFEDNSSPPLNTSLAGEKKVPCALTACGSSLSVELAQGIRIDDRVRSPEFAIKSGKALCSKEISGKVEESAVRSSECKTHTSLGRKGEEAPGSTEKKRPRCSSPYQNEIRESVIKHPVTVSNYPKFTGSPHKTTAHYGYPFLTSYGIPLAMMPRPSVITTAGSPNDFKTPAFPCYHCMQTKCCGDRKSVYADRHHQQGREMYSVVPSGFESPTVDDHFKKSLGPVYDRLSPRGQQYDLKSSTTCPSSRGPPQEPPTLLISKTIAHQREVADHCKSEYYHSASPVPDHVYRDYAMAPTHKRHHYHFDPIGRFSPEHLRGRLPALPSHEHLGLNTDHRYLPRSLEEPCSVEEHFAKALGQVWFDVQGYGADHVRRYHSKGLPVAHQ